MAEIYIFGLRRASPPPSPSSTSATMSAGGGPRATGSNLKNEGQFRQRVVSYYKIMADSRKSLSFHCKLQMASAVGLASTTGAAAVASNASTLILFLTGFAALSLGVASRLDHARSDKAQTAAYQLRCKLGLSSVLGMAGGVAMDLEELQEHADRAVMAAQGVLALVALLSCVMGVRAAGQLLYAFELQTEKKGQAAPAAPAAAAPPTLPVGRGRRSK